MARAIFSVEGCEVVKKNEEYHVSYPGGPNHEDYHLNNLANTVMCIDGICAHKDTHYDSEVGRWVLVYVEKPKGVVKQSVKKSKFVGKTKKS